jgi:CRP-like cAMP-binding protein
MMDLVEILSHSEIFTGVAREDLEALIAAMEHQTLPAGAILFKRGDEGDKMYEIVAGSIRIYTEDAQGNELTIVVRRAGEVVGEMTLLDRQPRSASAIAAEPTELLVLDREHFLDFLRERPAVGLQMMRTLTRRIRYTTNYLQKVMDWINRMSKGDYETALQELANEQQEGEIQKLIGAFIQMAHSVKAREQSLQQELEQLREGGNPDKEKG